MVTLKDCISSKYLHKDVIEAVKIKLHHKPFVQAIFLDNFLREDIAEELRHIFSQRPS